MDHREQALSSYGTSNEENIPRRKSTLNLVLKDKQKLI